MFKACRPIRVSLIAAAVLIATAIVAYPAKNNPLDELIQKAKAHLDRIEDLRAEIEIRTTFPGELPQIQKGKLLFKSPDKSRMEMILPQKFISISNGKAARLIDPRKGKSTKSDLGGGLEAAGRLSANEVLKNSHRYEFKLISENDESVLIEAVSKAKKAFIGRVEMRLDSRALPAESKFYNAEGRLLSASRYDYQSVSGLYVQQREITTHYAPNGGPAGETEIKLENIEVNNSPPEAEFEIK